MAGGGKGEGFVEAVQQGRKGAIVELFASMDKGGLRKRDIMPEERRRIILASNVPEIRHFTIEGGSLKVYGLQNCFLEGEQPVAREILAGVLDEPFGTVQSSVMLEKGACVPQRLGVFTP